MGTIMRKVKCPVDLEEDQILDQSLAERLAKALAVLNDLEECPE
jgi:hypothetical protein